MGHQTVFAYKNFHFVFTDINSFLELPFRKCCHGLEEPIKIQVTCFDRSLLCQKFQNWRGGWVMNQSICEGVRKNRGFVIRERGDTCPDVKYREL